MKGLSRGVCLVVGLGPSDFDGMVPQSIGGGKKK